MMWRQAALALLLASTATAQPSVVDKAAFQGYGIATSIQKVDGRDDLDLEFEFRIHNKHHANTYAIATWDSPLEDEISESMFTIEPKGSAKYMGRIVEHVLDYFPKEDTFILSPGETKTARISASDYLDFTSPGEFTLQLSYDVIFFEVHDENTFDSAESEDLKQYPLNTNKLQLSMSQDRVDFFNSVTTPLSNYLQKGSLVNQPVKYSTSGGEGGFVPVFQDCDATKDQTILTATADAARMAQIELHAIENDLFQSDWEEWFGTRDSGYDEVRTKQEKIVDFLLGGDFTAICASCNPGTFAYVYPNDALHRIHLCPYFFTGARGDWKVADSKAGTMIHEASHFSDVADTDDHGYGQTQGRIFAQTEPHKARTNADNFEYYNEDPDVTHQAGHVLIEPNLNFPTMAPVQFAITVQPECSSRVATLSYVGDGYCDRSGEYNTAACGFDGGDCCESTCINKIGGYQCGSGGFECADPRLCTGPDCPSFTTEPTVAPTWEPTNQPTHVHCGNQISDIIATYDEYKTTLDDLMPTYSGLTDSIQTRNDLYDSMVAARLAVINTFYAPLFARRDRLEEKFANDVAAYQTKTANSLVKAAQTRDRALANLEASSATKRANYENQLAQEGITTKTRDKIQKALSKLSGKEKKSRKKINKKYTKTASKSASKAAKGEAKLLKSKNKSIAKIGLPTEAYLQSKRAAETAIVEQQRSADENLQSLINSRSLMTDSVNAAQAGVDGLSAIGPDSLEYVYGCASIPGKPSHAQVITGVQAGRSAQNIINNA